MKRRPIIRRALARRLSRWERKHPDLALALADGFIRGATYGFRGKPKEEQ